MLSDLIHGHAELSPSLSILGAALWSTNLFNVGQDGYGALLFSLIVHIEPRSGIFVPAIVNHVAGARICAQRSRL